MFVGDMKTPLLSSLSSSLESARSIGVAGAKNRVKSLYLKGFLYRRCRSVFVLSSGRTGTTMLASVLDECPEVKAVHELRPHLYNARREAYDTEGFSNRTLMERTFSGERMELFREAVGSEQLVVDASPFLSFFAPALHESLPRSRFIYMHRDPETFVVSGMRRGWYERHGKDPFRLEPRPGTSTAAKWPDWSRFQKICWLWSEYNRTCLHCFEQLDSDRRLELPVREFWSEPDRSLRKILAFIDVPEDNIDVMLERMKRPANVQKKRNNIPDPADWPDEWRAQLDEITGEMKDRLGYAR